MFYLACESITAGKIVWYFMLAKKGGIQLSESLRFMSCTPTLFASPYLCFFFTRKWGSGAGVVLPCSAWKKKGGGGSCGGSVSDVWVYLPIYGSNLFNLWLSSSHITPGWLIIKLYRHEWFTSTECVGQKVLKIGNLVPMTILIITGRYSHSGA